jgi:hypothetical protein
MKSVKNLPVYVLSGALIFVGIASASQAQGAWTSKESSRIKALEAKVKFLESEISSQELTTIRFLATGGAGGTYNDICPGVNNLEGGRDLAYIGRLSPKTDILGRPVTDIRGEAVSPYVYTCKVSFVSKKSN